MGKFGSEDYPGKEEVTVRLGKYLRKRAKDLACPVCHTYQWNVTGIVDLDAGHLGEDDLGSIVLPVIVTVCEQCSYVRQFAWGAVRDATEHG